MKLPNRTDMISSTLSAVIWTPLPLLVEWLGGGLTPSGRESFLNRLPLQILWTFLIFVGVALLMHRLFIPRVRCTTGRRFWLLPLVTLPAAATACCLASWLVAFVQMFVFTPAEIGRGFVGLIYSVIVALVIVLGTLIWATYPMALANQFLIRWLYTGKTSAWSQDPTVKQ